MRNVFFTCLLLMFSFLSVGQQTSDSFLVKYVDPLIGSSAHGHVFVGASAPFGAVQLGPTNFYKGWDWCSGYHYSDSVLIGFSHTHLSGTGGSDLGDILVMPYTGPIKTQPGEQGNPQSGYASKYSHQREKVAPSYYSVILDDYGIKAELTASERVGFHQYYFPEGKEAHVIIDLKEGISDQTTDTYIKQIDDYTLVGYRFSKGWAADQRVYFAVKSSQPVVLSVFKDNTISMDREAQGKEVKGILSFRSRVSLLKLKVGISPVSSTNALANIKAEIPEWNFQTVVHETNEKWNRQLGKIRISTTSKSEKRIFYTAIYHTMIDPSLFNDHNGDYRGTDKKIYAKAPFTNYSTLSLWDTYRTYHPFMTIFQKERVNDFINTMLAIYKQQGKLPIWHLQGNETNTMVGYSAIPVIVDAYLKGFRGFDANVAFEAMKASSNRDDRGVKYLKELGFIPSDKENEAVAKALEYCISDWCIAQMAKRMGKVEDYKVYSARAEYYKKYFDKQTNFMRGRMSDYSFRTPFDPFHSVHRQNDYTEGNAWQYTWLVPHDPKGLIALFGNEEAFVSKLDSLFMIKGDLGEQASPDISGLIGMYAQGNEPDHHVPYLYSFAGYPWKTAEKVHRICKELFTDKPDGICGNEDCGQMSAWYIMSTIGFYPVNPANGLFVFGSPAFEKVVLDVGGRRKFTIRAINHTVDNIYIQSARLNGKPYLYSYIKYQDIMKGGELELVMGNQPNKTFGQPERYRP